MNTEVDNEWIQGGPSPQIGSCQCEVKKSDLKSRNCRELQKDERTLISCFTILRRRKEGGILSSVKVSFYQKLEN